MHAELSAIHLKPLLLGISNAKADESCRHNRRINPNSALREFIIGFTLSRVYEAKNSLKFEHEMKGKFIKNYHALFLQNNFEAFEHKLSFHVLTYLW